MRYPFTCIIYILSVSGCETRNDDWVDRISFCPMGLAHTRAGRKDQVENGFVPSSDKRECTTWQFMVVSNRHQYTEGMMQ